MADETNYPRFREDNLSMLTLDNVQGYEQGRPDVIARRTMGSSRMCKVFCAVNHIRNPLPCRDSVRIFEESVYNELYMKGYRGEQLETEYKKMLAELEVTPEYWLHYNNLFNGVVSEVTVGKSMIVPQLNDSLNWLNKYDSNIR